MKSEIDVRYLHELPCVNLCNTQEHRTECKGASMVLPYRTLPKTIAENIHTDSS